jgi:hypothetical protein
VITSTGESELLHGSEQMHERPDPLTQEKTSGSYHRERSSEWAIPQQVVERIIGVIKRFAKLSHIQLYVRHGKHSCGYCLPPRQPYHRRIRLCVCVLQSKPVESE